MRQQELDVILEKVCRGAKEVLGDKLEKIILYGSRARGDYRDTSDIDIFVLADVANKDSREAEHKISACIGDLDLEYDAIVSTVVVSSKLFHKYRDAMPFFMNVIKEGRELTYA